ncbi:hypothetical protein RFI_29293 [Reticulomyxa filosa]|uniref:Uncharacterized protein n=1 Tax=Reticulomyxa filosa TaxID=46433 RepID=X6M4Y1_RETFI|nr:hypothetical protein RFI_29293 [Reticulomyxa filosa]|eukprot:ETO08095.1 hypothetical protein RFI_29293 [Reticulomyxa filosa]
MKLASYAASENINNAVKITFPRYALADNFRLEVCKVAARFNQHFDDTLRIYGPMGGSPSGAQLQPFMRFNDSLNQEASFMTVDKNVLYYIMNHSNDFVTRVLDKYNVDEDEATIKQLIVIASRANKFFMVCMQENITDTMRASVRALPIWADANNIIDDTFSKTVKDAVTKALAYHLNKMNGILG